MFRRQSSSSGVTQAAVQSSPSCPGSNNNVGWKLCHMFSGEFQWSDIARLSLVKLLYYCALIGREIHIFMVLLRQLSYIIKNQLKAPKAPYQGHFLPFAGSLWHKDRWLPCRERIYVLWGHHYIIDTSAFSRSFPYAIKTQ